MSHIAKGEFTVTLQSLALGGQPEGSGLARMSIDKTITGDFEGLSGDFHIIIAGGRHSCEFAYKLP